ncbi:Hypothetical predicted protein [Xyrichtys novacula]|uniref:Uncharacterized protein n=1 Tax=Xyrichtys novacula TaxID=13765 RepID=A0AAV1FH24_XYRNO|nr:Hypothetical predicted protein [Xyrichtys novacula]
MTSIEQETSEEPQEPSAPDETQPPAETPQSELLAEIELPLILQQVTSQLENPQNIKQGLVQVPEQNLQRLMGHKEKADKLEEGTLEKKEAEPPQSEDDFTDRLVKLESQMEQIKRKTKKKSLRKRFVQLSGEPQTQISPLSFNLLCQNP